MNEKILKIPYEAVRYDWDLLQKFLELKGNPKYIIVGNVDLHSRQDISDLGNLVGVEGYFDLAMSSIESLGELEYIDGSLRLTGCENIKTLGKLKKVEGGLWLTYSSIESLGDLEFVIGRLDLSNCENIKTLGKLKRVEGDLDLSYSPIESLGEVEFVGEILYIRDTNIPPSELNNVNVVGKILR